MSLITNIDIRTEYDRIQSQNHYIEQQRRDEIYARLPEYKSLQDEIATLSVSKIRATLTKGAELNLTSIQNRISEIMDEKTQLLLSKGYPADYLDPIYTCQECKDTGFLADNSQCGCLKKRLSKKRYEQSGIAYLLETENFDHLSYDYYEGEDLRQFKQIVEASKNFVLEFKHNYRNLLFYGTVGTGKSFLSCCIARELLEEGASVVYTRSADLFQNIADETFVGRAESQLSALYDVLYKCDLLIIDDLGSELNNAFVTSKLFELISARHTQKKSTIISSNISLEQIRDSYTDRVFSRIASNYDIYKFSGPDIRMRKKF